MESRLLLNVVVSKSATILKLLASKNETLLIRRNALLVLNLGLHILNRVVSLNLESDGLASQSLHKNLHTTTQTKHKMESRLLLNVVVSKSATILKLLASKNETLLIRRNALLV